MQIMQNKSWGDSKINREALQGGPRFVGPEIYSLTLLTLIKRMQNCKYKINRVSEC